MYEYSGTRYSKKICLETKHLPFLNANNVGMAIKSFVMNVRKQYSSKIGFSVHPVPSVSYIQYKYRA